MKFIKISLIVLGSASLIYLGACSRNSFKFNKHDRDNDRDKDRNKTNLPNISIGQVQNSTARYFKTF